ncbi:hypothetical protein QBC45DRAFT_391281 [Copromyces sp. CBS 386.78]|nr:hypothetical protein QBC45DRAFT_391281 [Copromyces sp. CBS 386.78]
MTTPTPTKTVLITVSNRGLGRLLLSFYLQRPSHTVIAALDLNERTDPAAAVKELAEKHGIDTIDVVIANASTGYIWPKVRDAEVDDIRAHMETNVFGFVELNPAAAAVPNAAYGVTKAAQHYLTGKLHHEEPWLTSFSIDPGWVRTDMGNAGARALGIDEAYGDPDESAKGMLKVFDAATRKTHSGKMWTAEGETVLF